MEQLKQNIYWICDDLRRMEQIGLKNSTRWKQTITKLEILNQKYLKAKKIQEDFFEKCSKTFYHKKA